MTSIADIVNLEYKPFDIETKISEIQYFFIDTGYSHFPVLENGVFLGNIAAEDAEGFDAEKSIQNYRYTLDGFFVRLSSTYFEVLQIFAKNHSTVVPILDSENNYAGFYEQHDVFKIFSETPFLSDAGKIIVVEKDVLNYSISQIAQIVESNGAQLLGTFVSESSNSKMQVTLKIGLSSINEILQAFRRYDYEIVSTHDEDVFINNLKERSEYLEKYMNI